MTLSISITFSEPVTSLTRNGLVVGNGNATGLAASGADYTATITSTDSGALTVEIAAEAAEDSAGNPRSSATEASVAADLNTLVRALPTAGALALALLSLAEGGRGPLGVRRGRSIPSPDPNVRTLGMLALAT